MPWQPTREALHGTANNTPEKGTDMAVEYERNLRGKELARQVLHLNGHQEEVKFVFFQPAWFFMILSISLSGLVPLLKYVALAGLLGALFELALWSWYFARTRRFNGYPGLKPWLLIQVRRHFMHLGRSAGVLSKPR